MDILLYGLLFVFGIILLTKGADWVTEYASKLAREMGISEFVIGITLVAVATSLPELSVSIISAFTGVVNIATGTIIGSNVSNICLIIGVSALIAPLATYHEYMKEGFVMLLFSILSAFLILDGLIWYEGMALIGVLILYIILLSKKQEKPSIAERISRHMKRKARNRKIKYSVFSIAGGLLVVFGAKLLIDSTIFIAGSLGISEFIIAIIVIAIGTSLPEFATSITAVRKGLRGIAIGNIIGSNIFNLSILGLSSLVSVIPVTAHIITIDLPIMLVVSALLLLFIRTKWNISRIEGAFLLGFYAVFVALQFVRI